MSTGISDRGPAVVAPLAVDPVAEQYIDRELTKTRTHIRLVDVFSGLMLAAAFTLAFFLTLALLDHWLIPGGLGTWSRTLALLAFLGCAGFWGAKHLFPALIRPINPLYAAQTIERAQPSLKNSLLNFLFFRQHRADVPDGVYRALQSRAAVDLQHTQVDTAVDRQHLIRLGYVLMGILGACCLYKILSPKDPFKTVGRVLLPWADIRPSARVTIDGVTPGNKTVFRGSSELISAKIAGIRDEEKAVLHFSTADGQIIDRQLPLFAAQRGADHQGKLPGDTGGLSSDVEYWITAGDAVSPRFHLDVVAAPLISVEKLEFEYPAYMGRDRRSVEQQGDIKEIEGTQVSLRATANQPIKDAWIEFDSSGQRDVRLKVDGQFARGTFTLGMHPDDRTRPEHNSYSLKFTTQAGFQNPEPARYRIDVEPDVAPEVTVVAPKAEELRIPVNGREQFTVQAADPDFALQSVRVRVMQGEREIVSYEFLPPREAWKGQFTGKYEFVPAKWQLKAGDTVELFAVAADNKSPTPNVTESRPRKKIQIVAADPQAQQNPPPNNQNQNPNGQQNPNPNQQPNPNNGQQPNPLNQPNPGQNPQNRPDQPPPDNNQKQPGAGQDPNGNQPPNPNEKPDQNQKPEGNQNGNDPNKNGNSDPNGQPNPNGNPDNQNNQPNKNENQPGKDPNGGQGKNDGNQPKGNSQGAGDNQPQKNNDPANGNNGGGAGQPGNNDPANNNPSQNNQDGAGNGANNGQPSDPNRQPTGDQQAGNNNGGAGGQPNGQSGGKNGGEQRPAQSVAKDGSADSDAVKAFQEHFNKQEGNQPNKSPNGNNGQPNAANQGNGQSGDNQQPGTKGEPNNQGQPTGNSPDKNSAEKGNPAASGNRSQDQGNPDQKTNPSGQTGNDPAKSNNQNGAKPDPNGAKGNTPENGNDPNNGTKGAGDNRPNGTNKPGDKTDQDAPNKNQPENGSAGSQKPQQDPQNGSQTNPQNGNAGAGQGDKKNEGSPEAQAENRPSDKNSSGNQKGENNAGEDAQSPSNAPKQSTTQGENPGDRSGGGKSGGGQNAKNAGTGNAGTHTNADEGQQGSPEGGGKEKSNQKGTDAKSDQPTGQAGNDKGKGSSGKSGEGQKGSDNSPGRNAKPETGDDGQGAGKSKPGDGSQGDNSQPGLGKPNASNRQSGEPYREGDPSADPANLDYANKVTDLLLQRLKDQMRKGEVDQSLLDKLGWSQADMESFVKRWEKMKADAQIPGRDGDKARKDLNDSLRSLGLRKEQVQVKSSGVDDKTSGMRDAPRTSPPPEYQDQFRRFNQGSR